MFLQRYEEHGKEFLGRIVVGDKTWVFHNIAESTAESRWRSWLGLCAASRKVASSITDDIVGILL
jgi:hypothetical protein